VKKKNATHIVQTGVTATHSDSFSDSEATVLKTDSRKSTRKATSTIRRELTEEEILKSPAAIRLICDDLDRLESDNDRLKENDEKCRKCEVELAIYIEKNKRTTSDEIMYGLCLSIGSLLIGLAPGIKGENVFTILGMVIAGGILIGITIVAKVKAK